MWNLNEPTKGLISLILILISPFLSSEAVNATRQLQILKLFNNLNCNRTQDSDYLQTGTNFNPLDHLDSYKNPEKISSFVKDLLQGHLASRFEPFTNDQTNEMIRIFDILYSIDIEKEGWDLFYNTTAFLALRVNTAQFFWAFGTILTSKFYGEFKSPPLYELFPQLYAKRESILDVNSLLSLRDNNTNTNLEDQLGYFRHDPVLNSFHANWHVDFPFWWDQKEYGLNKDRKGELFLNTHHQLTNRYKAERLSNKLPTYYPLVVDKNVAIEEGDVPDVININFVDFPTRLPNSYIKDTDKTKVEELREIETQILDGISQGYFIAPSGSEIPIRGANTSSTNTTDIVGRVIEASVESVDPKFYGSLHNWLHRVLAKIPDAMDDPQPIIGVLAHPETAMQDPLFYRLHLYIDNIFRKFKYTWDPYTSKEIGYPGVDLNFVQIMIKNSTFVESQPQPQPSRLRNILQRLGIRFNLRLWPFVSTPVLTTYFEDFTFDISNAIRDCEKVNAGVDFTTTTKRLNHYPFDYVITIFSQKLKPQNATIRIFISPIDGPDGKPFSTEQLYWNMIEMDKFPVLIKPGQNVIKRSSQNSSVTIADPKGFRDLIRESTENSDTDTDPERPFRLCGYPNHLLVPKGSAEGTKFKMFVIISPASEGSFTDEGPYPAITLCGIPRGKYPDGRNMGFPFDRKVNFSLQLPWMVTGNYKFLDVIVKHVGNR